MHFLRLTDAQLGHILAFLDAKGILRCENTCPRLLSLRRLPVLERRWVAVVYARQWGRDKLHWDLKRLGLRDLSPSTQDFSGALAKERVECEGAGDDEAARCDNFTTHGFCAHRPREEDAHVFVRERLAELARVDAMLRAKQILHAERRVKAPLAGASRSAEDTSARLVLLAALCVFGMLTGFANGADAVRDAAPLLAGGVATYALALAAYQQLAQPAPSLVMSDSSLWVYSPSQTLREQGVGLEAPRADRSRSARLRHRLGFCRGSLWGGALLQVAGVVAAAAPDGWSTPRAFAAGAALAALWALTAAASALWHWRACPACRGLELEAAELGTPGSFVCPPVRSTCVVALWHSAVLAVALSNSWAVAGALIVAAALQPWLSDLAGRGGATGSILELFVRTIALGVGLGVIMHSLLGVSGALATVPVWVLLGLALCVPCCFMCCDGRGTYMLFGR